MNNEMRDPNAAADYIIQNAGKFAAAKAQRYQKLRLNVKIAKPQSADNTMRLLSNQPVQEVFMPSSDFKPICLPCVKCGSLNRNSHNQCRPCAAIRAAAWRAANPDKTRALRDKWASKNPQKMKESVRKWNSANKEKRQVARASRYAKNTARERLLNAAWYAANKEKVSAYGKRWNADNPEAGRIKNHARRARKNAVGGVLSRGITEKLFALQRGKCPCCNQPLGDNYHLDHITPLALGGSNSDGNAQLLRAECNLKKSAKHPVQYMQEKGFLL